SRRRHTRFSRDWSSDVCSSDLATRRIMSVGITIGTRFPAAQTSMGRVLLAASDPGHAPEVPGAGWALVDQELEPGLRAIAAPVQIGRASCRERGAAVV